MRKPYVVLYVLISFVLTCPTTVFATVMQNSNWIVKDGNFNPISGTSTNSNFKLNFSSQGYSNFTGTNYTVTSGFQLSGTGSSTTTSSASALPSLRFTISNLTVNFGELNPGEPILRANTVKISNSSSYGYTINAKENHPMRSINSEIADTTCDSGTCTETSANAWTSPLTYGFGYRCDNISGTGCNSQFSQRSFYKQFANTEANETAQNVAAGSWGESEVQITYKVNIAQSQKPGDYENIINYIAAPTF